MKYNLVGYGSLISHKSLRRTIPDRHFTPVLVKGYKRVFNLSLKGGDDPDVLNVVRSKGHSFNGVLFQVDDTELRTIKERESDYNLEESFAYDFAIGKKLCKCLLVTDLLVAIDRRGKKPNKDYFLLCREAAYHISKKFGQFWDETTYTSKGDKISYWLKNNKVYENNDPA